MGASAAFLTAALATSAPESAALVGIGLPCVIDDASLAKISVRSQRTSPTRPALAAAGFGPRGGPCATRAASP